MTQEYEEKLELETAMGIGLIADENGSAGKEVECCHCNKKFTYRREYGSSAYEMLELGFQYGFRCKDCI